jgi:hypothetical protein
MRILFPRRHACAPAGGHLGNVPVRETQREIPRELVEAGAGSRYDAARSYVTNGSAFERGPRAVLPSFYERYLAGEYAPVWRELIDLGEAVHEEPLHSDALAVCREIVQRARANLRTLHERLTDLGYHFADPAAALVDAGPDAEMAIRETEAEFGTLPLIARVWYGALASVKFDQADEQRIYRGPDYPPPMQSDVSGLGSHPVLLFQSLDRCRAMWHRMRAEAEEAEAAVREVKLAGGWPDEPFEFGRFLPLGGWASNCDPKGFPTPCSGVDAVIYNDGAGDTYFVDELREAFRWGGFPFWRRSLDKPRYCSSMEYRPNFAKVLPVLREGLQDL